MRGLIMKSPQEGMGLIEVLVALLVIAVGLLGMAGLQVRAQQAEMEALQRTQALILVDDIVNRMTANRASSTSQCYAITNATNGSPFAGVGNTQTFACSSYGTNSTRARAEADLRDWDAMLKGAGEQLGGIGVGAMTGARGCIVYDSAARTYTASVAWQGLAATRAPDDACGKGLYGTEVQRRVVSRIFRLPDLN